MEKFQQMQSDDLAEMTTDELQQLIDDTGDLEETTTWDRQAILDYIIDKYAPHCISLHSETKNDDYIDMHPDETAEEFDDHEDYEPRD